jgi:hypothetical protein
MPTILHITPDPAYTVMSMSDNPNASLAADFAALVSEPAGRIPVIERRLNAHAESIKGLEQHDAAVPESRVGTLERKVERLMWMAAMLIGGGAVLIWMIERCIQLIELSAQLKGK